MGWVVRTEDWRLETGDWGLAQPCIQFLIKGEWRTEKSEPVAIIFAPHFLPTFTA